ncbi:hypothetical protein C8F01DRAFT_1248301 [Mycena amicta]|nr:hypothetical protein C8F01DRAFT_1248301 [Mycena amicta]
MEDSQQLVGDFRHRVLHAPLHAMKEAIDPIHTVTVFMLSACVLFSKTCIEVSWPWPARYIAKPLNDPADVVPVAAALGRDILRLLSVVAELMGAIGNGGSFLMVVTTIDIYSYWDMRESGGPYARRSPVRELCWQESD